MFFLRVFKMTFGIVAGIVIALAALVYLAFSMMFPEKF